MSSLFSKIQNEFFVFPVNLQWSLLLSVGPLDLLSLSLHISLNLSNQPTNPYSGNQSGIFLGF